MNEKKDYRAFNAYSPPEQYPIDEERIRVHDPSAAYLDNDVFGNEAGHSIRYKTLSWQLVAVLMIAEIVSNGMLSLPSSAGVVGVSDLLGDTFLERLLIRHRLCRMSFSLW
jgi:hypothetical protein